MRAIYPTSELTIERNHARIHIEVYDNDAPTIFLLPTWQILHARHWKLQIPYLARHFRVVTYDPVGNGKSDRPADMDRYSTGEILDDAVAVLDATDTATCIAVGLSLGGRLAVTLGALHPERMDGIIPIAAAHNWTVPIPGRVDTPAPKPGEKVQGWAKYAPEYWQGGDENWKDFAEWFLARVCSDPHSTKAWDDSVSWALETSGDIIALAALAEPTIDIDELAAAVRDMQVPALIIHGTEDEIISYASAKVLQDMIPHSELLTMHGAGHNPMARYPVKINTAIKDFADRTYGRRPATSRTHVSHNRQKKVLYVSSPIGLGHARRDLSIAQEMRKLHPEVQIDWLAQDPVTRVLAEAGESIHPASALLANESAHIEDECGEHALAAFQAIRNMDEILLSNFMIFDEVLQTGEYDLVVGDEAWEIDHHLHENPTMKKTAFAWMTDFVGFLPVPSGGEREIMVAADYNAEMIEHVERFRRIRDTSIFVGSPADIVPDTFGEGLPSIKSWTEDHFEFCGYVTGFDPADLGEREELRAELGYHPDEQICIVSVGGSGVGADLIRRVANAYPAARRTSPNMRMIVVAGPRIDPAAMPQIEGVEYLAYVDRLYRHLAVADLAIVQGGLTTTMELTASKVPFIYVPLRDHFEQNFHVRARLDRYQAGRYMDYEDVHPDNLAEAISEELGRTVEYLDVETDGATRAASMIAELI